MPPRSLAVIATIVLVAAACTSGGAASPAASPSTVGSSAPPSAAATPEGTLAPGGSASSSVAPSPAAARCTESAKAGAVAVSIADFEFKPPSIEARVGQVIAFSNTGFEPHNVTLDDGGCATRTLQTDEHDGLVFTNAGAFAFHCSVHAWMSGTITIGD